MGFNMKRPNITEASDAVKAYYHGARICKPRQRLGQHLVSLFSLTGESANDMASASDDRQTLVIFYQSFVDFDDAPMERRYNPTPVMAAQPAYRR